jgi:hypothetical protein
VFSSKLISSSKNVRSCGKIGNPPIASKFFFSLKGRFVGFPSYVVNGLESDFDPITPNGLPRW